MSRTIPLKQVTYPYPFKRIRIFLECELEASFSEIAMIDTRIMQRLRFTKQLGNSNISYPTAEHSRFSHSLGVLYWVSRMLSSFKGNYNKANNEPILQELNVSVKKYFQKKIGGTNSELLSYDTFFGVSWFEQLVRLYGLLHDITHVPFGHTIEDQSGMVERHDDDLKRLNYVFERLSKEVSISHHFGEERNQQVIDIFNEYIYLIKTMFIVGIVSHPQEKGDKSRQECIKLWEDIDVDIIKPLVLAYDIVSNTICADLMDYTQRDTLYTCMPKTFDKSLLSYLKLLTHDTEFHLKELQSYPMYRLGVSVARKKVRHDVITAILDLLRIRYDLTEKVYYHHSKMILDAMLEKVLRSVPKDLFTVYDIYDNYLGDEGFLSFLDKKINAEVIKGNDSIIPAQKILLQMFSRDLYKSVFRINLESEHLNKIVRENLLQCKEYIGRNTMEEKIINIAVNMGALLEPGDIIISYPPKKMQKKIAKALIEWPDGAIYQFEKLPKQANYSDEIGMLTERYDSLWSMTIYINSKQINYIKLVESICEEIFDIRNDSILTNYLTETYPRYYATVGLMNDFFQKALVIEANYLNSKTAKGKNSDGLSPEELLKHMITTVIGKDGKKSEDAEEIPKDNSMLTVAEEIPKSSIEKEKTKRNKKDDNLTLGFNNG